MGLCKRSLHSEMVPDTSDSSEGETEKKVPFFASLSLSPSFGIFLPYWPFSAFLTLVCCPNFPANYFSFAKDFCTPPSLAASSWGPFTLPWQQGEEGPALCMLLIRHQWPKRGLRQSSACASIRQKAVVHWGRERDKGERQLPRALPLQALPKEEPSHNATVSEKRHELPPLNTLINTMAFFQVCWSLVMCPWVGHWPPYDSVSWYTKWWS